MLRVSTDGYTSCAGVLPLGLRAGVPGAAAAVDAAEVLRTFDPVVAEQCEDPAALLLPVEQAGGEAEGLQAA